MGHTINILKPLNKVKMYFLTIEICNFFKNSNINQNYSGSTFSAT